MTEPETTKLVNSVGFNSVSDFIGYCELHSLTERALLNGKQISVLCRLAGDTPNADAWAALPNTWRSCDLTELCVEARLRVQEGRAA